MNLFEENKIKKIKIIVLGVCLLLSTLFFAICLKRIFEHEESYYSVKGRNNEYIDLSGEKTDTNITAIGNDIRRVILYTTNTEINGTVRYSLIDQNNNVIYDNSELIDSVCEESDNPLVLPFENCSLKKGKEYSLIIDFSSFNTPINIMCTDGNIYFQQYYTFQHHLMFSCILITVYVSFLLMIFLVYRNGFSIKNFVLGNLIIGTVVLFIMPPANRDDEFRHFLRAYELGTGELKAELIKIPNGTYGNAAFELGEGMGYYFSSPKKVNDIRLTDCNTNYNDSSYFSEVNSTVNFDVLEKIYREKDVENYSLLSLCAVADRNPIFYFPMSFAILIGRLLNVNGVFYFYLARFGQLLVCIILGVLALKLAPNLKNAICLATFAPPIVLLRSSCNTDGLLISLIIMYVALLFYIKEKKIDLLDNSIKGNISFIGILALAGIVTLMKLPYIIVCLGSLFILDKANVKTIKRLISKYKYVIIVSFIIGSIGCILMQWKNGLLTSKLYSILPEEHIRYIVNNPKYIIKLFAQKFIQQMIELYNCMNTALSLPYSIVLIISMCFSSSVFSIRKRLIFFITFVATVFSIILVGYTLTPPDYGRIWGITYRYLLPSLILLLLCLPSGNNKTDTAVKQITPLLICAIVFSSIPIWFTSWWLCL